MLLITDHNRLPIAAENKIEVPTLGFVHAGQERTLVKHREYVTAWRAGHLTLSELQSKPWQLRAKINGRERYFTLPVADRDAIRSAKDILNSKSEHPTALHAFLAQRDAARGLTLGQLAAEWIQLGLPFSKTKSRSAGAASHLKETIERALPFWEKVTVTTVDQTMIEDFVVWRREHCRPGARFTGSRSADLQLGALSSLCRWAILAGKLKGQPGAAPVNPFEKRDEYAVDVKHCHQSMPANDDQLHQILTWLFTQDDLDATLAGAWLAMCTLTGLRPGEPAFLKLCKPLRSFPVDFAASVPGTIYRLPDGSWRMKVHRLKNGQNPAIIIHPALRDFLHSYRTWHKNNFPRPLGGEGQGEGVALFPDMDGEKVCYHLERACLALKLPIMKPHGFGRGYYVRVRRSQGTDDIAISVELGQTTSGKLIRNTYGNPIDPVGGNLHDWLPSGDATPAWKLLLRAPDMTRPCDTSNRG